MTSSLKSLPEGVIKPSNGEKLIWGKFVTNNVNIDKITKPYFYWLDKIGLVIFIVTTLYFLRDLHQGKAELSLPMEFWVAFVFLFPVALAIYWFYKRWNTERAYVPQWLSARRLVYWDGHEQKAISVSALCSVETFFHGGSTALKLTSLDINLVLITADADKLRAEIEGLLTAKP